MSERVQAQVKVPSGPAPSFAPVQSGLLQRKSLLGGAPGLASEFTDSHRKRLVSQPPLIQTKLTINQPNDRYEQEADRVADAVMRMPEPLVQRQQEDDEKDELIQTKPLAGQITLPVQRQAEEEEGEILQTKENPGLTPGVIPNLEARIQSLKGGGQPLPEANRGFMERRFGVDFSGVRIHTDSNAVQMSKGLSTQAFTYGKNIYFGAGMYAPDTMAGKRLLAHELAHVMQQTDGRVQRHCPPATRNVSQMTVLEKWCVALLEGIRPFVEELRIIIICLLMFLIAATYFTAYVMPVLVLIIPAIVIEVVTGLIAALGLTLAVYFASRAIETGTRAWRDLNQAIQNATTYDQLADAGRLFGRRLAQVLSDLGIAYLGLRALIRGYRATTLSTAEPTPPPTRPSVPPTAEPTPPPTRPSVPPTRRGRAPEFPSGRLRESEVMDAADRWLGTGYREVSSGRYISADGLRQFRMGRHETGGGRITHVHFEAYDRQGGRVIENAVLEVTP